MTTALIRLHPGLASPASAKILGVALLLLCTLLTGALVAARTAAGAAAILNLAGPSALALVWAAVSAQLIFIHFRGRACLWVLTLPVSARRLWLISLAFSIAASAGIILLMFAVLFASDRLLGIRLQGPLFFTNPGPQGVAILLAAACFAAAVLHLPAPGQQKWSWRAPGGLATIALLAGLGTVLIAFRSHPWLVASACIASAFVTALAGWRRQPESLRMYVHPLQSAAFLHLPQWQWLAELRCLYGLPALAGAVGLTALFGFLQAIMNSRFSEEDETGLFLAPMLVYIMLNFLPAAGRNLHKMATLPLSPLRITALVTLPVLSSALLGFAAGQYLESTRTPPLALQLEREPGSLFPPQKSSHPLLRLPAGQFEIAWDGAVPPVTSPWGETHKAWQAPIWRGARPVLYSTLSVTGSVTPDFAAWQLSQAFRLLYHKDIPWQSIRTSVIQQNAAGETVVSRNLDTLLEPGKSPQSSLVWATAPLIVLVCGGCYLLLAGFLFGLRRPSLPPWYRNAAIGAALIGLLLLYLLRVPLSLAGFTRGWILSGALSSVVRSFADALPGGAPTAWIVCLLVLAAAFHYAAARMARAEIIPEPPRRFGF